MDCFQFQVGTPLAPVKLTKKADGKASTQILWIGHKVSSSKASKELKPFLEPWQLTQWEKNGQELQAFSTPSGQVLILKPSKVDRKGSGPQSLIGRSVFAAWVELSGLAASKLSEGGGVTLTALGMKEEEIEAAACGLEIGSYRYKRVLGGKSRPAFQLRDLSDAGKALTGWMEEGQRLGQAVNLSRHLINTPPNLLNPKSFPKEVQKILRAPGLKVEVWDEARLKKEGMNLHLAVGQASATAPALMKVTYRPTGAQGVKPVAFVGKGITFDSGGLNIKPDKGMRLMKKDMGGAASLTALAWWVAAARIKTPCDFYLALAENSISGTSFRPSDILTARSGLTVEIDNTDAEGRLVLADALDVAKGSQPRAIVDVATLTGAIKVGLGSEIAGLFSNQDELAQQITTHGFLRGDLCWQMPLYGPMAQGLKSPVADMVNCTSGFGGAVTAALFLEKFVGSTPWVHVDIYGWQDKSEGAYAEAGGRGQMVLALSSWLKSL